MISRRSMLVAGASAPLVAAASSESEAYAYVRLEVARSQGLPDFAALAQAVEAAGPQTLAPGVRCLGLFTPQLGWRSDEAVLLLHTSQPGRGSHAGAASLLPSAERLGRIERAEWLSPTVRPVHPALATRGGVHVHRWLTLRAADLPRFIALSQEGWADFETRFDARVYGLFQAATTAAEARAGNVRLLLLTRYGSHAVWEASRDPSTAGMRSFAQRRRLTLSSEAASSLLLLPRSTQL